MVLVVVVGVVCGVCVVWVGVMVVRGEEEGRCWGVGGGEGGAGSGRRWVGGWGGGVRRVRCECKRYGQCPVCDWRVVGVRLRRLVRDTGS